MGCHGVGVARASNEGFARITGPNTPFELRGSTVVEFRDGKISRNSDYWDLATFMKQVGPAK